MRSDGELHYGKVLDFQPVSIRLLLNFHEFMFRQPPDPPIFFIGKGAWEQRVVRKETATLPAR